jgi:hypothetical protein
MSEKRPWRDGCRCRLSLCAAGLLSLSAGQAPSAPRGVTLSGDTMAWHAVTLTFVGPPADELGTPNPFLDYRLTATFTNGIRSYDVPGHVGPRLARPLRPRRAG